jgi:hypothetical protein
MNAEEWVGATGFKPVRVLIVHYLIADRVAAVLACFIPAIRATPVEPVTLRN